VRMCCEITQPVAGSRISGKHDTDKQTGRVKGNETENNRV